MWVEIAYTKKQQQMGHFPPLVFGRYSMRVCLFLSLVISGLSELPLGSYRKVFGTIPKKRVGGESGTSRQAAKTNCSARKSWFRSRFHTVVSILISLISIYKIFLPKERMCCGVRGEKID